MSGNLRGHLLRHDRNYRSSLAPEKVSHFNKNCNCQLPYDSLRVDLDEIGMTRASCLTALNNTEIHRKVIGSFSTLPFCSKLLLLSR